MASLEIHQFPCRSDNFGVLIHDVEAGVTASIDAPEGAAVERALTDTGWRLTHIITTCLLYTSPSPRDLSTSRMPSSA